MATFPLLLDEGGYRATTSDLGVDADARGYWLAAFRSQLEVQLEAAAAQGAAAAVCDEARRGLEAMLTRFRDGAPGGGRFDLLVLDAWRRRVLRRAGIVDEFRHIKQRENAAALAELPAWLTRIDSAAPAERWELIVRGLLAGNLFDMGAAETADRFAAGVVPAADGHARVPPRPWRYDDLPEAEAWIEAARPAAAVIFADNAGADAVLGVLPLARWLHRRVTRVVVAANRGPSLNDVTAAELEDLRDAATKTDPEFAGSWLEIVDSGRTAPLIDLKRVSARLAAAAADAELCVLLG
ncbi:MAG: DUF89 family protein, partial [Phycisphaerales bacterium]|nr:DUF89 family protein [Phycisphaerales bacterium]